MRVALADDAVILREGLSRLLEEAGFEVVGLAADAEALLELIDRTHSDVAIIDIRMPPTHTDEGLRAAKIIRERWPAIGILVLSQHVNPRYALELLSTGTDGCRGFADRAVLARRPPDRCRRDHQTQQRSATMKTRLRTYTSYGTAALPCGP
jgi:CheY-like chemotaxis protein